MWAWAAAAPACEAPAFSTATPIPARAQRSSAAHQRWPSPSASRYSATERTPSSSATASSQSSAPSTAWLPHETTVCSRRPRREASAFTATLPPCEISATGPASRADTMSPHSAMRAGSDTIPLPFGPQTGRSWACAAAISSSCRPAPLADSAKPAANATAPPQPRAPIASTATGTSAAGIATTTASTASGRSATLGTHGYPWTSSRRGFTP